MRREEMEWLGELLESIEWSRTVILRLGDWQWEAICGSRRGLARFTAAYPHSCFEGAHFPTACFVEGSSDGHTSMFVGILASRSPITTLESRVTVEQLSLLGDFSEARLPRFTSTNAFRNLLQTRLSTDARVVVLSPRLSRDLIEGLAGDPANHDLLRPIARRLAQRHRPAHNPYVLQEDALRVALKILGLSLRNPAMRVEVKPERSTALGGVVMEDGAIAHDARRVPGYSLEHSDITGRAVFVANNDYIEVYTANRMPLEQVFGVDLIYLNRTRENIVMLQYKMLEDSDGDWLYRPDQQMFEELQRMHPFAGTFRHQPYEYRLNPGVFYFKFVKRRVQSRDSSILVSLDHLEVILSDPRLRGPRGGHLVSYEKLEGRYLREDAFVDLFRSGYIGAYSATTEAFRTIIDSTLAAGRSAVAVIQDHLA